MLIKPNKDEIESELQDSKSSKGTHSFKRNVPKSKKPISKALYSIEDYNGESQNFIGRKRLRANVVQKKFSQILLP